MEISQIKSEDEVDEKTKQKKTLPVIKLKAYMALTESSAMEDKEKTTAAECLWEEPRRQREPWRDILERDLLDSEPRPLDQEEVESLLHGQTLKCEGFQRKIIRIFISSTFTDTAEERNLLIADVYPYLKEFGRKYGFEFVPSEMRWGIREESSSDHKTSEICMAEIKRCQEESLGINYIVLLCDKYGFRPFPAHIEANEFEALVNQAKEDNSPHVGLLSTWFQLDTNVIPPLYRLKSSTHASAGEWWGIFENIQMTLRDASKCLPNKDRAKAYIMSVTEEEVHNGLFKVEPVERNEKTFFYRRHIQDIEKYTSDKTVRMFVDMKYGAQEIDQGAQKLLHELQNEALPNSLPADHIKDYIVPWGPGISLDTHAEYLRDFSDHFCDMMVKSMSAAIKSSHVVHDGIFEEVRAHAQLCREKSDDVIGRDEILQKISGYLGQDPSSPLVVWGPSGAGKTSIMARAIKNAVEALDEDTVLIYRFLGTTLDSTSVHRLLRSLCLQLCRVYGGKTEKIASDFNTLLQQFPEHLELASDRRPLVMFLDSLDQLSDEYAGRSLVWLPFSLPSNVRLVVSTLPDIGGCLKILQQSLNQDNFIEVPRLGVDMGRTIMGKWLENRNRGLMESQMGQVLSAFQECPYPLYLKIAFETSCNWASFTPDHVTTIAQSVKALIDSMFDELCRVHGNLLVSHALGYLTTARFGLTATELEDILSCDDEVLNDVYQWWTPPIRRLPPLLWVRIRTDLGPYLVERTVDGEAPILAWYHRQFCEAAEERFLSDKSTRQARLSSIAEYFMGKWAGESLPYLDKNGVSKTADRKIATQPLVLRTSVDGNSSKTRYNLRKLTELPSALIGARRWTAFSENICTIPFIEAKCAAGLVYELVSEMSKAAKLATADGSKEGRKIEEFVTMLRLSAGVIDKHPKRTFQQAINCPDASFPEQEAQECVASGAHPSPWLRMINKPQSFSRSTMKFTFKDKRIFDLVFSADSRLVCFTIGGTSYSNLDFHCIAVLDTESGALLKEIPLKTDEGTTILLKYSVDHESFICVTDIEVLVINCSGGALVKRFEYDGGDDLSIKHTSLSIDGKHLAVTLYDIYSRDARVTVLDLDNGSVIKALQPPFNSHPDDGCSGRSGKPSSNDVMSHYTRDGRLLVCVLNEFVILADPNNGYDILATHFMRNDLGVGKVPSGDYKGSCGEESEVEMELLFLDDGRVIGSQERNIPKISVKGTCDPISGKIELAKCDKMKLSDRTLNLEFTTVLPKERYSGNMKFTPTGEQNHGSCNISGTLTTGEGSEATVSDFTLEFVKSSLAIYSSDVSTDSATLVVLTKAGTCDDKVCLRMYDLQELTTPDPGGPKLRAWIPLNRETNSVRCHPTNKNQVFIAERATGVIQCYDISNKQVLSSYNNNGPMKFSTSSDGALVACIGSYMTSIWDTSKQSEVPVERSVPYVCDVMGMTFSNGGTMVAAVISTGLSDVFKLTRSADPSPSVHIIDVESGKLKSRIKDQNVIVYSRCAFTPDDKQLMVLDGQQILLYDVTTGEMVTQLCNRLASEEKFILEFVCFSPTIHSEFAVVGQKTEPSDMWYCSSWKCWFVHFPSGEILEKENAIGAHRSNGQHVDKVLYSKDGAELFIMIGQDIAKNGVFVYDAATGKPLKCFPPVENDVCCMDFYIYEDKLLRCTNRGAVWVNDLETGNKLKSVIIPGIKLGSPQGFIFGMCYKGDDAVVFGSGKSFIMFDLKKGLELAYVDSEQDIRCGAMATVTKGNNSDKTYFAYADSGKSIRVVELV